MSVTQILFALSPEFSKLVLLVPVRMKTCSCSPIVNLMSVHYQQMVVIVGFQVIPGSSQMCRLMNQFPGDSGPEDPYKFRHLQMGFQTIGLDFKD